eukprot:TRINITY_DN1050_c0_g2_i1.p1 TRINITY_DN1050_c0_g2~~TRINITY_DN1050_c0_g2_i1.p1  ORF type:complete len:804 (-),score=142.72 TRINITY_DN1050_c0_g2_i1:58-2469(-)
MNGDKSRKGKGKQPEPPPPEPAGDGDEKPKLSRSLSIKSFVPRGKGVRRSISARLSHHFGKEDEEADIDIEDPYAYLGGPEAAELVKSNDMVSDLTDRKLTSFPETVFELPRNLQMITAGYNEFSKLPVQLGDFTFLVVLVLNNNKISELPKSLGNLTSLKFVNLHSNLLTGLPRTVKSWTQVTKLLLSHNRIASFPIEICKMTALQQLKMDNNQLYTVPDKISALTNLEMLELTHNYIRPLPSGFFKLAKVKQIRLGYNQMDKLPDDMSGLSELNTLDLSYNLFPQLPAKSLSTIPKLEDLDFDGNNLVEVSPDIAKLGATLKRLSLAKNELVDLPEEFSALKKLEALDLRGNPLAGLKFGLGRWKAILVELTGLGNLQTGNLPQKKIQMLNPGGLGSAGAMPTNSNAARTIVAGQKPGALPPKPDPSEFGMGPGGMYAGGKTMPALRGGPKRGRPQVDLSAMFEQPPPSPTPGNGAVTSPKGGAGTVGPSTFDMWKTMSANVSLNGDGESDATTEEGEATEEDDGSEITYPRKEGVLIQDFGCVEDMNKAGIIKAKKEVVQQEDTHCEHYPFADNPHVAVFCVFDGHGGKECSTAAIRLVPTELAKWLKHHELKKDASNLLHVTFMTVDEIMRVYEYEGCTATVVLVWSFKGKTYVQAANVGDSFAFLSQGTKTIDLSQEHKLTKKYEQTRFDNLGIAFNEGQTRISGGIAITRALGDHYAKDNNSGMIAAPYISPAVKISGKQTHLIVASDGLWDVMGGAQSLRMAKKSKSAAEAAQRIVRAALKNKECKDNITVTVVRL